MLQRINEKAFPLFFVLMALAQFGTVRPMELSGPTHEGLCTDPCQPPTGTTIADLPQDCLGEVLMYLGKKNPLCLRHIDKNFKAAVDNHPCFFINKHSLFLNCLIARDSFRVFYVMLHNEKVVDKFLNGPLLSKVRGQKFHISMKLDEEGSVKFLPLRLKKLGSLLENKKNTLESLKINYHGAASGYPRKSIEICSYKNGGQVGRRMEICCKDNVSNEELNLFGGVQEVEVRKCKNFGSLNSDIVWPKGIQCLELDDCQLFFYKYLKKIPTLQSLCLIGQDGFRGNELKCAPKGLKKLSIHLCKIFKGPEALGLEELCVEKCEKFDISLLVGKNLRELMLLGYMRKDFPKETLEKLKKNGCRVFFR